MKLKALALFSLLAITPMLTAAESGAGTGNKPMVFTQRAPDHHDNTQNAYGIAILKLALENTRNDYGDYVIKTAPSMNTARAILTMKKNSIPNFLYPTTYDEILQSESEITHIPFPLVQGLLGYRVCFYPEKKKEYIYDQINRGKFQNLLHGQGKYWTDVAVLEHNGLPVVEVDSHKSMYKMVSIGRIDLFCRGANEAFKEYNHFNNIDGVGFDRTFVLQYDLPVFFFLSKENTEAVKRIKTGLIRSYENGSLRQLLFKHFAQSLEFVALDKRKFYHLENPYTKDLDPTYKNYYLYSQSEKMTNTLSP